MSRPRDFSRDGAERKAPEGGRRVSRGAVALGLDTASTDHGPSAEFPVHRVLGAANAPGFENLTGLERLPATGAYLLELPMKIEGGSGGPLRAVALVPRRTPA